MTAMSGRPASLRLATTFDPMKPAPPVTSNIDAVIPLEVTADPRLPQSRSRGATLDTPSRDKLSRRAVTG